MLPFLVSIASNQVPDNLSYESPHVALVAEAKRLLPALGVPGPYTVEYAGPIVNADGTRTLTSCNIKASNGLHYEGYFRNATGRLFALQLKESRHGGSPPKREEGSRSPEAQRARAAAILARVAPPFRLLAPEDSHPSFAWKYAEDEFWFPIAVHGHPFVEHGKAGYGLRLDAKTGNVLRYTADDALPQVGDPKPLLSGDDALAVVNRLLVSDPPQKYVSGEVRKWTEYITDPSKWLFSQDIVPYRRRLGWFVPVGETSARLVWAMPYWIQHHIRGRTGRTQGSGRTLVIDAITGERIGYRE